MQRGTALITGSSKGIGLEFAHIFAREGHNLVLVARSTDKLKVIQDELSARYPIKVFTITADLSAQDAAQKVFNELAYKDIHIDYLINNAGFGDYGPFSNTSWQKEQQMISLNVETLVQFCKLYVPEMLERKSGKILNVASIASFFPGPGMAVYYATKAFVLSFSEALSCELEGTGVTVTSLCPGPTKSNFFKDANMLDSKVVKGRRLPSAHEVALYGYRAMNSGNVVAIQGWFYKLLVLSQRFIPRSWVRKMVGYAQKQ